MLCTHWDCSAFKHWDPNDYLLVETCRLHFTSCNKTSCAEVQISITIRIQALRDVFNKK